MSSGKSSGKREVKFDPNFGLPPEEVPHDWEFNEGHDTFKRVSKVGRSNIDFLRRMEGNAVDGGDEKKWMLIKDIGKSSLELRDGAEVDKEEARQERLKRLKAAGIETDEVEEVKGDGGSDNDDESSISDSDSDSDSDDSDGARSDADDGSNAAGSVGQGGQISASVEDEDANNMLDNDWDTSEWSLQEIESACMTLLTECEKNASKKRQSLSIRMLLRLLDRHQEAVAYIEKVLCAHILLGTLQ